MTKFRKRRRSSAQSIIETVVGIIFLIPIVLFLFDVVLLVLGNTSADQLTKNTARAAASAADATGLGNANSAETAAKNAVARFSTSVILPSVQLVSLKYQPPGAGAATAKGPGPVIGDGVIDTAAPANPDPGPGLVSVVVSMDVQPLVPFPGVNRKTFYARAVEPIVSLPPQ